MRKRWGHMETLLKGKQFKVKFLYFGMGKGTSYQKHDHRSELWLFIEGKGKMRKGNNVYHQCHKGESELIKRGQWHQFTADRPTLVLEIQFGGHCSERDIERAK
jgi:mannose-6-phosphate isomerase-like protein (cupin superfamily)